LIVKVRAFIDQVEFRAGEFRLSEDRSVPFTYPPECFTGDHLHISARDVFMSRGKRRALANKAANCPEGFAILPVIGDQCIFKSIICCLLPTLPEYNAPEARLDLAFELIAKEASNILQPI
jgi:hypothetical protein